MMSENSIALTKLINLCVVNRQQRFHVVMQNKSFFDCKHDEIVKFDDVVQNHSMSNDNRAIQNFHDILQSYYKMTRKKFVDCIRMQTIDYHLITKSRTSLTLFSSTFVTKMTFT